MRLSSRDFRNYPKISKFFISFYFLKVPLIRQRRAPESSGLALLAVSFLVSPINSFGLALNFLMLFSIWGRIKIFLNFRTRCHSKEKETTQILIQPVRWSQSYFLRSGSSKLSLKFPSLGERTKMLNFFIFEMRGHSIEGDVRRVLVKHKWWDHSWFVRYFIFWVLFFLSFPWVYVILVK